MNEPLRTHIRLALSVLVGFLGADRLYDGQVRIGILKLVLNLLLVGLVWYVVDILYYAYLAGKTVKPKGGVDI